MTFNSLTTYLLRLDCRQLVFLADLAGASLAFTIFLITSHASRRLRDHALIAVALALLCSAGIHIVHAAAAAFGTRFDTRTVELLWSIGRILGGFALIVFLLTTVRKKKLGTIVAGYGIPVLAITVGIPAGYIYKGELPVSIPALLDCAAVVILAEYGAALALVLRGLPSRKDGVPVMIAGAAVFGILSEIAFMTSTAQNTVYVLATALLLLSRACMLNGVFLTGYLVPYRRLIRNMSIIRSKELDGRRKAEARADDLDMLRSSMTDILGEHDSSRLVNFILTRAIALLKVSGGELALFDKRKQEFIVAATTFDHSTEGSRIAAGEGIVGSLAQTREPVVIHGRGPDSCPIPSFSSGPWYAIMAVPMAAGNKLVGALLVAEQNRMRNFTQSDLHMITLFAQQAALAVWNAQLLEEARRRAETDSLTGLYNHGEFFNLGKHEVNQALRYHHALSVIMVDIDHFKKVNDTYGHAVGDLVLRHIARLCKQVFRKVDVVGRYGGEEFSILLPETRYEIACEVAERLRKAAACMEVPVQQGRVRITISIGVAAMNKSSGTLSDLLEQADQALYLAKSTGRNRVCTWDPSSSTGAQPRITRTGPEPRVTPRRTIPSSIRRISSNVKFRRTSF